MNQKALEKKLFSNHYDYYKQTGLETIKQQAGQVEQISSDYEGRVIYEMLQNTFDKADKNILVKVHNNSLYIANDGTKFTYTSEYNYREGGTERGDFQSLCSISTSTKNAGINIGNKGVGFKSAFSIAKEGYVNVFTNGEIISENGVTKKKVSFSIYDSFKDADKIPLELDEAIRAVLLSQIPEIQKEQSNRGVPGYYYPIFIEKEPLFIDDLFQQGYVTVIEIPFADINIISDLLKKVRDIHLKFIGLKHKKEFNVQFEIEEEKFKKETIGQPGHIFSFKLDNNHIKDLANKAGIILENPIVAFSIREDNQGLLYNYLPTGIKSPFPYIDFHADFHTTVDRKSINFDLKIGAYNRALLAGCIELYWSVLNSYIDQEYIIDLKLDHITQKQYDFTNFNWNLIQYSKELDCHDYNMSILRISNKKYSTASAFFTMLAKKYFSEERTKENYDAFYNHLQFFIHLNATTSPQYTAHIKEFKNELAKKLINHEVRILPHLDCSKDKEILYKKTDDKNLEIPDFVGITITSYQTDKPHGDDFKKALGIKDFSDYNELLKYYKQCTFSGEYSEKALTEVQQQKLLYSLFEIFNARDEQDFEPTHRFSTAYTPELREKNSTINQAKFNVSTIFLKTRAGKFKPAQLCIFKEINEDFLGIINNDPKKKSFLLYLGVSFDTETIFADERIYDKLKNGLAYPPALFSKTNNQKDEINDLLISHLYVITNGNKVHPSLINDNNYKFLHRFYKKGIKNSLEILLVKKYDHFPKEYRRILKTRLELFLNIYKDDIIRLYQSLFHMYHKDKEYLVISNNQLRWTNHTDFKIVNSKSDFDLIKNIGNISVLCYYSVQNLPQELERYIAKKTKGTIEIDVTIPKDSLKDILDERMMYLLVNISHSKTTELNFLEDDKSINEILRKIQQLQISKGEHLRQTFIFDDMEVLSNLNYAFDETKDSVLYFLSSCNESELALGIAEYLFSNSTLRDIIQLVIFYKNIDDLKIECDPKDIQIVISKCKPDYDKKFEEFQKEIGDEFDIEIKDNWFIYNSSNRSEALIQITKEGKLTSLKYFIEKLKDADTYKGYFEDFEVEINFSHIEDIAAELLTFLKNKENETELTHKISLLVKQLGSEQQLTDIKLTLLEKYPEFSNPLNNEKRNQISKKLELNRKIEDIFQSMNQENSVLVEEIVLEGHATVSNMSIDDKKTILQRTGNNSTPEEQVLTGTTGEERALIYFINEFLKLSIEERIIGIHETYALLQKELGNYSHDEYRDACIAVISSDIELRRTLIPFFYVTLHHKFAYVDLIVYKNKVPTLIEVKSTKGDHNKFFISIAEVNVARKSDNYELLRVAKDKIYFIGNPIKLFEAHINQVKGDNYILTPRNYEFNFNK